MKTKKSSVKRRTPARYLPGTVPINVVMPEWLHEAMKTIATLRGAEIQEHVKICTIYREAVERFVQDPRQKRLLDRKGLRKSA